MKYPNAIFRTKLLRNRNSEPKLNFSAEIHPAPSPLLPEKKKTERKNLGIRTKSTAPGLSSFFLGKIRGKGPGRNSAFQRRDNTSAHVSRVNYRGSIKYRFLGGAHAGID